MTYIYNKNSKMCIAYEYTIFKMNVKPITKNLQEKATTIIERTDMYVHATSLLNNDLLQADTQVRPTEKDTA